MVTDFKRRLFFLKGAISKKNINSDLTINKVSMFVLREIESKN